MTREIILLAAILSGCAKHEAKPKSPVSGESVLRLSQRNEPADLDPARATLPDDFFIIRALSEGLLIPDSDGGAPRPGVAESYEVSADGLTYTFHLRTGAQWSNGEPVTAGDFVASYRRLLDPATAAPKTNLFFAVKNAPAFASGRLRDFSAVGFSAANDSTLIVSLEVRTPLFPRYVASGPWIPVNPRVVEKFGRNWTRPENFVGNGPFRLVEWRPHQRIVVERSQNYNGQEQAKIGAIEFLHFDNADAEDRAYRAGQVDVTMDVPKTKIEVYAAERPAELHRIALAETRYLSFNCTRAPLDNRLLRRALSLAIDRQKLVERVTLGGQLPAERFLPPLLRGPTGELGRSDQFYQYDPVAAKQLLESAGFAGGKNLRTLELSGWSQNPVLEAVQEMWRQNLGIDVRIVVREAKVHVAALQSGDYDIGFITSIPDVADGCDMLGDFMVGAPGNYPHFRDDSLDVRLYLASRGEGTGAAGLLLESEGLLYDGAAVAPLYFNAKNWLMSPRVHGWREDALWERDYRGILIEEK